MGLRIGIIGLANVGKSTLFNALLGRQAALTAPYPFATVEPNVGVVEVPDERLVKLREALFPKLRMDTGNLKLDFEIGKSKIENQTSNFKPQDQTSSFNRQSSNLQPPLVFATVTFVDIAGLVKGAAEGKGLGNQFLSHIRDVDLILHVLRDFDGGIPRAEDSKNPEDDAEIVRMELELKDLELKEKNPQYGDYLSKKPVIYAINIDEKKMGGAPKESYFAPEASGLALAKSDPSGFGRSSDFSLREKSGSSEKPVIYAVNVGEDRLAKIDNQINGQMDKLINRQTENRIVNLSDHPFIRLSDSPIFYFSAKVEEEISKMPKNEQKEYLKIYGLKQSCLDRIISECFQALGLISFFTAPASAEAPTSAKASAGKPAGQAGKWEIRAWPIKKDSAAPQAAAVIHSDFEKLFIRAEVIGWEKLAEAGSWQEAKNRGWVRTEGRDYLIQDGDVCNFLISR